MDPADLTHVGWFNCRPMYMGPEDVLYMGFHDESGKGVTRVMAVCFDSANGRKPPPFTHEEKRLLTEMKQ